MSAVLETDSLRKRYGRSAGWALDGLDLRLEAGEGLAVVGLKGAGQTMLARLAAGLSRPDSGILSVQGGSPTEPRCRASIGYVPRAPGFPANLRPAECAEYVACLLDLDRAEAKTRTAEALDWAGLNGERRSSCRLSPGRLKRLALALALLGKPRLLVVDEPGEWLDPEWLRNLGGLLSGVRGAGCAVLLCSSQMGPLERACGHAVLLAGGRPVAAGRTADLVPEGVTLEAALAGMRLSRRLADQVAAAEP